MIYVKNRDVIEKLRDVIINKTNEEIYFVIS